MDNYLNILRIDVDNSDRVYNTTNLSLNQCSNNNRIAIYYNPESEYDYIEMSFRKPDGWLSDKVDLIFDVDEEGYKYAYYDIHESFTSFIMGGRNAILTANIYFHRTVSGTAYTSTAGNIRINVNYVDDALVNTDVTGAYVENLYAIVGALQTDFNQFKTGDIQVGKALMDGENNVIHRHYETKADAVDKFNTLDDKKLDKSAVQDQNQRLETLETDVSASNLRVTTLETNLTTNTQLSNTNKADIATLKETTITDAEFNKVIDERKAVEVNLQSQIDGLHQGSNFRDMVDFASKLTPSFGIAQGYKEGDRILALNTNTVYKWNGSSFDSVGIYGSSSYTKSEIDAQHNTITNSIPNKVSLSNGELKLSKGNTPISIENVKVKTVNGESIWGEGNIVIPVDSEFSLTSTNPVQNKVLSNALLSKANTADLNNLQTVVNRKAEVSALENKQDKLIAGSNIKIEGNIISASAAITLKKVEALPAIGSSNIIYLYKPVNEDTYSEYLWDEEEQRFEPFGEAGLHLEKYYTMLQVDELLSVKVNLEEFEALSNRVTRNTSDIAKKADAETTSQSINSLNSAVLNLQSAVSAKADRTDITNIEIEYARKDTVPEAYQEVLKSGQNIKTVNGISILGSGDLGIVDQLTDLSIYYTKAEADPKFALKSELFDKDYGKLNNTPDLNVYRLISDSYSKQEVDEAIAAADISDRLTDYYNKEEIDNLIENVDISEELQNYPTKEELAQAIEDVDVSEQLESYATKTEVANTYLTQVNAGLTYATKDSIERLSLAIPTKTSALINDSGYITIDGVPKDLSAFTNNPGYLTAESQAFKNKQDKLIAGTNIKTINGESLLGDGNIKIVTDVSNLETKNDAENKLASAKAYTDTAKQTLQSSISQNTTLINALRSDLTNEVSARSSGDATTLAAAKTYTDTTIREVIEDTEGALEAIKEIKEQIGSGESGVGGILTSINNNKTDITNVRTSLQAEVSLREAADSIIQDAITENTESIDSLQTQINTEIQNRTTGDSALSGRIETLSSSFESHKTSANDSLVSLNNKITAEEAERRAEDQNIYFVLDNFTTQTDTKISNVQDTVGALNTRLESAQKDINDHKVSADDRFSSIEESIAVKILFKNWVS